MSQVNAGDFPIDPQVTSGTALADILNRWYNASQTQNSGATPPPVTYPGQQWYNTSVNPPVLMVRNAGNTGWVTFTSTLAIKGSDITGLGTMANVNSPAPVANGGTGSTTAAGAVINLGLGNVVNQKQVINISPSNTIQMHWNGDINLQIDSSWMGNQWPLMSMRGSPYVKNGANPAAESFWFSWSDPGGIPAYLWGGDSPAGMYLVPPGRLSVNYATSANTCNNAGAVNGISGWNYANRNYNPAYLWASQGSGTDQFLVTPANLSVSYANSSGSTNNFGGQGTGYFINNAGSALVNERNNGAIQIICGIGGAGDYWWPINMSDARVKRNITPTKVDALAEIMQIEFVEFEFRTDLPWHESEFDTEELRKNHPATFAIDDGRLHQIGVTTQQLLKVNPELVETEIGTWQAPKQDKLLWRALRAIQQLEARIAELEGK